MTICIAFAAHLLRSPRAVLTAFGSVCLLSQACTGYIEANPGGAAVRPSASAGSAGVGPASDEPPSAQGDIRTLTAVSPALAGAMGLRGLTRLEYDNTVSAILGERVNLTAKWGEEIRDNGGFSTARPISAKEVEDYFEAAEVIAGKVKAGFARFWSCDSTAAELACAEQFVTRFGRAAFRRPLLDVERTSFMGLFEAARSTHGLALDDSVALVSQAILQSPSFMYHWELGPQPALVGTDGNVALTPHEVAARVSYFLTQAPPDAALAADADSGRVLDPQALEEHVVRLLEGPTTAGLFRALVAKMLNLTNDSYGAGGLDAALLEARHRFIDSTLGAKDGSTAALLLSTDYYVNEQLAPLYGISGVSGDALVATPVNPAQRQGILTHADYLKFTGEEDDSMPPRRGLKLLTEFLCQETPPMPAIPPDVQREEGQTQREFFENVVETQPCAKACHGVLDPLGFAFEHYGGSAWRDTDRASGKPINSAGTATLPFGTVVAYQGAIELIQAVAASEEYRQCMTRQVFRMATGRAETGYDVATLQSALEQQRSAGDNLRATLAEVISSDAFRLRRPNEGEVLR